MLLSPLYHPCSFGVTHLPLASRCASCFDVLASPRCKQLASSIPVMSYTSHVSVIPSFMPSIFRCHSLGDCNSCLSHCASRLHVLVAPHKQPGSNILVMSCTPHVTLIPSFPPSLFWQQSCRGRIWLDLSRQQCTVKQPKNSIVSYTKCLYNTRHN